MQDKRTAYVRIEIECFDLNLRFQGSLPDGPRIREIVTRAYLETLTTINSPLSHDDRMRLLERS